MRFHEFSTLTETADKPKSRTYKQFSVEANLVLDDNGYGTVFAYNGSPRAGGKKIGGAMVHKTGEDAKGEPTFQIYKSAVDAEYRRKGVARAMYDAIEAYCNSKGGYLIPASSVSDEAFGFWNGWKPHRIAYDGRHVQDHYLGKTVTFKERNWTVYHSAGHGYGNFLGREVDGQVTTVIPRQVVFDQLGDFLPKTPAPYPPPR